MEKPSYTSKKGKRVELEVSRHALLRLKERWHKLHNLPEPEDLYTFVVERFSHAVRIVNYSRAERTRLKRYGKDTLYFRHNDFTFIVQDSVIVTIEISNKGQRHLNKP